MTGIDKDKYKIVSFRTDAGKRYKIEVNKDGYWLTFDDANGYGYKTYPGAMKSLYYKLNRKEIEEKNQEIENLFKELKPKLESDLWIVNDISYIKEGCPDQRMVDFWDNVTKRHPELEEYRNNKIFNKYLKLHAE